MRNAIRDVYDEMAVAGLSFDAFYDRHWLPLKADSFYRHSALVAKELIRLSIARGNRYALESLQIAINDIMGESGIKRVRENGSPDQETLRWFILTLNSSPDGEEALKKILV